MDRSLNYEKILIRLQIENTEGKVRNTIARYGLILNSTSLCSLRAFSFVNSLRRISLRGRSYTEPLRS